MADVASKARTIEEASVAFLTATTPEQRSTAERYLLQARKWPIALGVCHHLLVHSTGGYAKLQALYMARECLGTQWAALSPAERSELQMILLQLQTDPRAEQYVRAAAAQMLSLHAKHDLLHALASPGEAPVDAAIAALLAAARQMLEEYSGTHAPAALELLHSMLGEFGAPSLGAAGGSLPWSMHARARNAFQERQLLEVVHIGLQHLQRLAPAAAAPPPWPPLLTRALALCASLLASALSWDFSGVGEAAATGDARPGLNASVVRPPAGADAWSSLIGSTQLLSAVVAIHRAAMGGSGGGGSGGGGGRGSGDA